MTELVLALHRSKLTEQGIIPSGIHKIDMDSIDGAAYGLIPRHIAGNKSPSSIQLGTDHFGQVIVYMQLMNEAEQILLYQRKSKDGVLEGKWSIGVGGHVSHEDLFSKMDNDSSTHLPDFCELLMHGTYRELEEETQLNPGWFDNLVDLDEFKAAINSVIVSDLDPTSSIHIGFPMTVEVGTFIDDIQLDPKEFLNPSWVSKNELVAYLKAGIVQFETWTKLLVEQYAQELESAKQPTT